MPRRVFRYPTTANPPAAAMTSAAAPNGVARIDRVGDRDLIRLSCDGRASPKNYLMARPRERLRQRTAHIIDEPPNFKQQAARSFHLAAADFAQFESVVCASAKPSKSPSQDSSQDCADGQGRAHSCRDHGYADQHECRHHRHNADEQHEKRKADRSQLRDVNSLCAVRSGRYPNPLTWDG
jgi:hypothetical protein